MIQCKACLATNRETAIACSGCKAPLVTAAAKPPARLPTLPEAQQETSARRQTVFEDMSTSKPGGLPSAGRDHAAGKIPPVADLPQRRVTIFDPSPAISESEQRTAGEAARAPLAAAGRRIVGVLVTYSWSDQGQVFPVFEGRNRIGSDPVQCDIAIPRDDTLSAVNSHVVFRKNFTIGDDVSMGGTDVDGEPVETAFVPLRNYARIRTGSTHWTFIAVQPPSDSQQGKEQADMLMRFRMQVGRPCVTRAALVLLASSLALAQVKAGAQDTGSLFGPRGVSPESVRQGVLGSCYFHASIASLAKAAPATLRGAIGRSSLGGYRVHFFNGPDEVVFPDDIKYGRAHSFDRSEGDWVLVLMRGYAQRAVRQGLANAIQRSTVIPAYAKPVALEWLDHSGLLLVAYDRAIRSVVSQEGKMDEETFKQALTSQLSALGVSGTEAEMLTGFLDERGFFINLSRTVEQDGEVFGAYKAMGQGGIPVRVIEAFMGSAHSLLLADHEITMDHLGRLHRGGMAMVAGSWGTAPPEVAEAGGGDWWVGTHAYSVLAYDDAAQTVSMRNPWGSRPDKDGVFTLPLSVFLRAFEFASFSD